MILLTSIIKSIALLSYILLALLTVRSKAERQLRLFFLVYLCGMIYWQLASLLINFTNGPQMAILLYNLLFAGSGVYIVLFLPLTRAFLKIKGQRVLTFLAYAMCIVLLATGLLGLEFKEVYMGNAGYYVPRFSSPILYFEGVVGYFLWGVGVFNLVRGLAQERSAFLKNRIRYVLIGAIVVIIGTVSNFTPLRDYPVDISANVVSALFIGYAVVRYRLLDIRVVLVRSLFYSVLTAVLIAAYLGIVFGLERILKQRFGYNGPAYAFAAIFALAIVFLPLRNLLQRMLDRLFFREKLDYQTITDTFSRAITSIYDTDEILGLVERTIMQGVRPGLLAIALLNEETRSYDVKRCAGPESISTEGMKISDQANVIRWLRRQGLPLMREEALADPHARPIIGENPALFETADVAIVIPIPLKDRLLGTLYLSQKLSGTVYNAEDLRFLTTIANQTATALEKSTVYREIQRRLSEQTLLFILSEKFRGSAEFDTVMDSVVHTLKSFLSCDYCAIVSYERDGGSRIFANDHLSKIAADLAGEFREKLEEEGLRRGDSTPITPPELRKLLRRHEELSEKEREAIGSFVYLPLQSGDATLGMLIVPNRSGGVTVDPRELELLRTIRAIISQGIVLDRTIINLVSVKTYNENILNSLNDMGDTLVILDVDGKIKSVNRATCERLGYREEDLVGKHMSVVAGEKEALFSETGIRNLVSSGSIANYEMRYRGRDGSAVPVLFSGSVMVGEDGTTREIVGIARDITEHLKAEEMAKNALLVQEIHHRIKNNLQVISSLLFLQSGYVSDDKTREMFQESQDRVRSMALLHEKLYQSQRLNGIDFGEYIRDLTQNLFVSYGINSTAVEMGVNISDIVLGMDTAVPCGLIINELVSNALKHAFGKSSTGEVKIAMHMVNRPASAKARERDDHWYEILVTDNGKGFPEGIDFRATKSLGLRVVCTLTRQLDGQIEMERDNGTRFSILVREQ